MALKEPPEGISVAEAIEWIQEALFYGFGQPDHCLRGTALYAYVHLSQQHPGIAFSNPPEGLLAAMLTPETLEYNQVAALEYLAKITNVNLHPKVSLLAQSTPSEQVLLRCLEILHGSSEGEALMRTFGLTTPERFWFVQRLPLNATPN